MNQVPLLVFLSLCFHLQRVNESLTLFSQCVFVGGCLGSLHDLIASTEATLYTQHRQSQARCVVIAKQGGQEKLVYCSARKSHDDRSGNTHFHDTALARKTSPARRITRAINCSFDAPCVCVYRLSHTAAIRNSSRFASSLSSRTTSRCQTFAMIPPATLTLIGVLNKCIVIVVMQSSVPDRQANACQTLFNSIP